ncbi:HAMP domain-containing protein [Pseudoalteromonas sp. MMG010]|uniref:ATP-binding protein n=1 Tax=Pseudoalteromonas sp. MMG010 TaxID=2822685 RepID=UPI001B3A6179|nr:ATP-binding protein [Pseudoalteromonas sp. MMG010]MBQ4832748.1 HAMP domain-containing protein [Pseudoalteromonas sp. MMG010]
MSSYKENNTNYFAWLKHPTQYLFFKIFIWFWLTLISTVAALVFLSQLTATNLVMNEPLNGPMKKNLIYTAKGIERSVVKHKRTLSEVLAHPRYAKRKLLYITSNHSDDVYTNIDIPKDIDLSLLNFTKQMSAQVIFSDKYQAYGPIHLELLDGSYNIYEIDIKHQPPLLLSLKIMPNWMKVSIAVIASLILSFIFSRNIIAPINSLKKAAIKLSGGDLTARAKIPTSRNDELGILGRDFNAMANQLEQLLSAQKRLLADISHELRSPLTRLKMATGLAQIQANDASQSYLLRIEKEANQLDKMIADVLQVSRLEAKSQALSLQYQPLQIILNHVINDAQFEAKQHNKQLVVTGNADINFKCDEALIASALENLLRNAIKYANNSIALKLNCTDTINIEICDDGPGVPEQQLSKLCEPFFRQSDARDRVSGGTGLGLAIAKNAITAHNGTLSLSNKAQGGLCAKITFAITKE